jgi:phenylacetate-coenzyme A ligase PaaK-like adenylate-forming protein
MRVLDNIRNKMFWFVDFIKGGKISKHYKEIKYVIENFNSKKAQNIRNEKLQDILSHATYSIPFYKNFKGSTNILDFPVISKTEVKNSYKNFISQEYHGFKKVVTSGSTGMPFVIRQDKNKRKRNIADTIYFANKAGFRLGTKLMYIRIWDNFTKKNPISAWTQNIQMHDVRYWDSNIASFVSKIMKDQNEKGIIGYASALNTLCEYLDKNNIELGNCNISSVIAISEKLYTHTKENLEKHFGKVALSRYSNVENGIIAQQNLNGSTDFNINWASYYVEVLKLENNSPTDLGELGRVVVTDLFNYHMPLIRYDTGDLAYMENNLEDIPVFKSIEGRKLDVVYDTQGKIVPSLLIGGMLGKYPNVIQFQFIQKGKSTYVLKLKIDENFVQEKELINDFASVFGNNCIVKIIYYDEIPLLSSGKRRYVINNYKKN